ncbi:MAG: NFACT family protein [Candidatus Aenigmarchaeota archaeon]|nr:NFACT family protein [Candidatus Aenigmarchaeota archaeon]
MNFNTEPEEPPQPETIKPIEKKKEMTSIDIRFVVRELKEKLMGGIFRKIYQYGDSKTKQLLFEIYVPDTKEKHMLYVDGKSIFLTKKKEPVPIEPPSFCMFLRKHLMGRNIKDIYQHEFDSIIEIKTETNTLIFELIRPGNTILCDSLYYIIMPLEIQRWKDREVKPKINYKYPPRHINPFSLSVDNLVSMTKTSDKKTVVFLAKELGFGGMYAKELCKRAGIDDQKPVTGLTTEELINLHKYMQALERIEIKPTLYEDMVSPFSLKTKPGGIKKESLSDAFDDYFSEIRLQVKAEGEIKEAEVMVEKAERIVGVHDDAREKWERVERESKESADAIYNFYSSVESVLNAIQKARGMSISWEELKSKIMSEESPEAGLIKDIREAEGIVVLNLGGKDIEIDFRKSVKENAAKYFEDSKWARKKLEGVHESAQVKERELIEIRERAEEIGEKVIKPGLLEEEPEKRPSETEPVEEKTEPVKEQYIPEKAEEKAEFEHKPIEEQHTPKKTEFEHKPVEEKAEFEHKKEEPERSPEEETGISTFLTESKTDEPAPMEDRQNDIPVIKGGVVKREEEPEKKPIIDEKPKWYEKYKWFISSDGFLVIAGRNAEQNENIIKKHTEKRDLVYHADIPGAAFVIVKMEQEDTVPDETRKEAAEFAAANSKAWNRGLGAVDVYSVSPEQVSKTPPSGEYLPKGSFMVTGERIWYKDTELKLSIGVKVDRENERVQVLAGPVMAIRINADYFITIKPGFKKSIELSRNIKNKILIKARPEDKFLIEKIQIENFEKTIPGGMGEIVEYG